MTSPGYFIQTLAGNKKSSKEEMTKNSQKIVLFVEEKRFQSDSFTVITVDSVITTDPLAMVIL